MFCKTRKLGCPIVPFVTLDGVGGHQESITETGVGEGDVTMELNRSKFEFLLPSRDPKSMFGPRRVFVP